MAEQNVLQNNALAELKIQTDIPLWKLLLQGIKKTHKLSRVEAFYDLIDRQCVSMLKGGDTHLSGSIIEIAKAWGWDRETVGRFLDNLEQLGAVSIDIEGNRKTFRMNCIVIPQTVSGDTQKPSEAKSPSSATNGT